jgi:NitT/TauT family transport system ATP-binding protein
MKTGGPIVQCVRRGTSAKAEFGLMGVDHGTLQSRFCRSTARVNGAPGRVDPASIPTRCWSRSRRLSLKPIALHERGAWALGGDCCPLKITGCANNERAICGGVCQYRPMGLRILKGLKLNDPDVTLRRDEREAFVASIEPVTMNSTVDPRAELISSPQRLAVDVRNVSLTFETADGKVDALSNVSLQIADGEFVSFIGPSGCGKTTMLRLIADLQQPTSGSLFVNGVSAEQARLERRYGYVFQAPALFPWRTIEKNLKLPLEIMGFSDSEQRQRAARYLALVNLTGFERKFPWQLSGGMQQRVSIARALSFDPELLLMDEPFGALDEIVRDHLNEQLLQLWDKTGKTVVFVTHSIPEAVFLSTKIVVMSPRPGRIIDIIDCSFPRNRTLEIRETPEFLKIAQRVRVGLRAGHSYDE